MADTTRRALTLCADDFGLAPGIDEAILDLAGRGRLTAVSSLVLGENWATAAAQLRLFAGTIEIGLHFALTHLAPAGPMPRLAPAGRLPSLARLIAESLTRRLDVGEIAAEVTRQIELFTAVFGRAPDFLDGHQHVHQLPGVRDAVFAVFRDRLSPSGAWLRYVAMPPGDALTHRIAMQKTWILAALGAGFRERGRALAIAGNGSFRGVRDGDRGEYAALFRRFVRGLGDRALIMCHPGFEGDPSVADKEAAARARRDEHAFLASDEFLAVIDRHRLRLARLREAERAG
jgi:predicted glycoside hydrolase/deacetylase ChbG (UPF0249 family)